MKGTLNFSSSIALAAILAVAGIAQTSSAAAGNEELTTGASRVSFQLPGKVKAVRVEEGAQVRKGQILAILEFDDSMARCVAAESELAKAKTDAERTRARAKVEEARADWEKHFIRAPISGTVVRKQVKAGETLSGVRTEAFVIGR